ncbi:MAG: ATP-binding protein [Tenericutes bacterium]|jgi:predicted AAA+ superfamily ATPase|nr:ATP-binding protein [Mycoplasmatota bacterium]
MERKITKELLKWKRDINKKPLLIYGPRQIGKTYSVLNFGNKEYKNIIYFDTNINSELTNILSKETVLEKMVNKLSSLTGETIFENDSLIIFDNFNNKKLFKSLKGFNGSKYHVILITNIKEMIESLKGEEIQIKTMYSMDFEEYLKAQNKEQLILFIKDSFKTGNSMPFHSLALEYFEEYLITGSMPEAIECYLKTKDLNKVRSVHQKIINIMKSDTVLNKNLIDITRSVDIIDAIASQLQKNNPKFQYNVMKTGSRASDYENSIDFLCNNNLIYRSYKISNIVIPLNKEKDNDSFKLFLPDTGLLYTKMHLTQNKLFMNNNMKNILYETAVANTLNSLGYNLYYYQSEGKAMVNFIINSRQGKVIPIEIVNPNLTKAKALTLLMNKFDLKEAFRITENNFSFKKEVKYIPVYAIFCLRDVL